MSIQFNLSEKDEFFKILNNRVREFLKQDNRLVKARNLLWFKLVFYALLYISAYLFLLIKGSEMPRFQLILNYVLIGITGMLLAFNSSHDACHGTFSNRKWVNQWIYHLSFNLQGVNAYLWQLRHISSHHIFPNVDGCDADIDENPFIRLSPTYQLKKIHKFQHLYAPLIYCIYTLHWIFYKDIKYLRKRELANLKDIKHDRKEYFYFFFWKFTYIFMMLILPMWLGISTLDVIVAFLIMSVINSNFFIHSLICTHFSMETHFPIANDSGRLPHNYAKHQLATALDYYPESKVANYIFGGFNAHAAHHLFPHLPHTCYAQISPIIQKTCVEFSYPYNSLNLTEAIASHFKFLRSMGRPRNVAL